MSPKSQRVAPEFPSLLEGFFCQHLVAQRNASARTVASYRDTFRLLVRYAAARARKAPSDLTIGILDAALIGGFLDHLERERSNCSRSRNLRLVAIRSFMRYVALQDPLALPMVQRVLAIPLSRFNRPLVGFLTPEEVRAILCAPSAFTWSGRRDRVMLATFYNTGARVSEVTGMRVSDVSLEGSAFVRIRGKGRKERTVPLWKNTASMLRRWLRRSGTIPDAPLFPNKTGNFMTRSGVTDRLRQAVCVAAKTCPTLKSRRVSPHILRHTTATHLLQSGVDLTVIAIWLGHESPSTTHCYVEADLTMKERALKKLQAPSNMPLRYRASDRVLAFLDRL
jgi:site-specific recombinase XerD